jgi:hypothetical protein
MNHLNLNKIFLSLLVSPIAQAGALKVKSGVGTNHNFDDKLVNGQYQYPDEATATVDDEKMLDDLIGVRKNFKDRLTESTDRR